jgi:hypothetical protein
MASSAVEQFPVEVWEVILHHAIASPILPFLDDGTLSLGLIDNLDLFSDRCHTFGKYRNSVLRLRSVCRTWSNILHIRLIEYAFIDISSDRSLYERAMRRTRRLYMGVPPKCLCQQDRTCILAWADRTARSHSLYLDENVIVDVYSKNVKILRLGLWCPIESFDCLTQLSNLSALSIDCELFKNMASLKELLVHVPCITHLQLSMSKPTLLLDHLKLPHILYLSLSLSFSSSQSPAFLFLKKWTFRSLRTFSLITGLNHFIPGTTWMTNFLSRHGASLSELSITDNQRGPSNMDKPRSFRATSIVDMFSYCCPQLTTIGMSVQVFDWMQSDGGWTTRHFPSRPIILVHGFHRNRGLSHYILKTFVPMKEYWNAEKIVFSIGWEDFGIRRALMRQGGIRNLKPLLNELLEKSNGVEVPIFDQHGTSLRDFLEGQIESCNREISGTSS